jgi:hypothetical protein
MSIATITPSGKPCWSRESAIGDYGGATDKRDSHTEGSVPYAFGAYRELVAMKGSAYSSLPGTLVHCQNLAKARLIGFGFRMGEQLAANAFPASADDGLDYWVKVLAVPRRPDDQKWQLRQRCAAHYRATTSVNLSVIQGALQELLGDAYVDASFETGSSMSSPPAITYWPGINPGPVGYDLGGGTWLSERCHLWVQVQRPSNMSLANYYNLINVQGFQLLDRMLPAYCTFTISEGDGFILDESQLDYTGVTPS